MNTADYSSKVKNDFALQRCQKWAIHLEDFSYEITRNVIRHSKPAGGEPWPGSGTLAPRRYWRQGASMVFSI